MEGADDFGGAAADEDVLAGADEAEDAAGCECGAVEEDGAFANAVEVKESAGLGCGAGGADNEVAGFDCGFIVSHPDEREAAVAIPFICMIPWVPFQTNSLRIFHRQKMPGSSSPFESRIPHYSPAIPAATKSPCLPARAFLLRCNPRQLLYSRIPAAFSSEAGSSLALMGR